MRLPMRCWPIALSDALLMTLLNWIGEHPWLSCALLFLVCWTIHDTTVAIMNGLGRIAEAKRDQS